MHRVKEPTGAQLKRQRRQTLGHRRLCTGDRTPVRVRWATLALRPAVHTLRLVSQFRVDAEAVESRLLSLGAASGRLVRRPLPGNLSIVTDPPQLADHRRPGGASECPVNDAQLPPMRQGQLSHMEPPGNVVDRIVAPDPKEPVAVFWSTDRSVLEPDVHRTHRSNQSSATVVIRGGQPTTGARSQPKGGL